MAALTLIPLAAGCHEEGSGAPRDTATVRDQEEDDWAKLRALGYADGEIEAPEVSGILTHDPTRSYAGLNLVVSAHSAGALLMDMEGNLLHRWECDFWELFPNNLWKKTDPNTQFWRRAYLFPNGDILGIFDGKAIVKLDKNSEVLWARDNFAHHDLQVLPSGEIYVLTRVTKMIPRVHAKRPVIEEFVSVLSPEGYELRKVSLLEALENSPDYRSVWDEAENRTGDILHSNTLEILGPEDAARHASFEEGRVLTSLLMLDAIALLDMESEQVVWAHTGTYKEQHDPQIVEGGNLILFDNKGGENGSRVLEYDPSDMSLVWTYEGSPEKPFFSRVCGAVQRLPNGNTLIAETTPGRALEVTTEGEVVWEYANRGRAQNTDKVAQLFDVVRLPLDFPTDWIP